MIAASMGRFQPHWAGEFVMRQAIFRDAYEIIGVQPGATDLEVKRAFRERIKKTHPDVNAGAQAQEEFLRLVAAYRATEVGRTPDLPSVKPANSLLEKSHRKLLNRTWAFLFVGAIAIGLYIRAQPPLEEPAKPEPVPVAHAPQPQNVEPVWVTKTADRSPLAGMGDLRPTIAAMPTEPQLPVALREVMVQHRDIKTKQGEAAHDKAGQDKAAQYKAALDTASADPADVTATATTASGLKREWEQTKLSYSVAVMPPRRPKHIGELRKQRSLAASEQTAGAAGDTLPPSPPPTKPETSILSQLTDLLGLH